MVCRHSRIGRPCPRFLSTVVANECAGQAPQGHARVRSFHDCLDAYAPAYLSRTRLWYLAKANAKIRQLGSSRNRAPVETTADSWASEVEAHSAEASQAEWKRIHEALSKWTPPVLDVPVVLVRSASAWNQVRPVYDAETNGLSRFLGTDLDTRVLHAEHLSMLTGDVEAVVDSIIDFLTISPRVPKPKSPDSQRWPSDRHPAQP